MKYCLTVDLLFASSQITYIAASDDRLKAMIDHLYVIVTQSETAIFTLLIKVMVSDSKFRTAKLQ